MPLADVVTRRETLLGEYRRRKGEAYRAERAARDATNAAAIVREWAAEVETRFARELVRNGPVVHDGRIYKAEKEDGVLCVRAYPVDSAAGGES